MKLELLSLFPPIPQPDRRRFLAVIDDADRPGTASRIAARLADEYPPKRLDIVMLDGDTWSYRWAAVDPLSMSIAEEVLFALGDRLIDAEAERLDRLVHELLDRGLPATGHRASRSTSSVCDLVQRLEADVVLLGPRLPRRLAARLSRGGGHRCRVERLG